MVSSYAYAGEYEDGEAEDEGGVEGERQRRQKRHRRHHARSLRRTARRRTARRETESIRNKLQACLQLLEFRIIGSADARNDADATTRGPCGGRCVGCGSTVCRVQEHGV
jgi:hypothetical protein